MQVRHPYHLVSHSPWPIALSMTLLGTAIALVSWFNGVVSVNLFILKALIISGIAILWWRDVIREGIGGYHTVPVQHGLYIGFLLFLASEIMLFISFFWAFFHSSLAVSIEISGIWPPTGVHAVNPWSLPLLGSCILLSSGFILTCAHHGILSGNKTVGLGNLAGSIIVGICFVVAQCCEYYYAGFTISDSVFGSVFYLTTGLHAIHVIIGITFLVVAFFRNYRDSASISHFLGLEFSIAYWHLVDVVWLFVFVTYYWWGS